MNATCENMKYTPFAILIYKLKYLLLAFIFRMNNYTMTIVVLNHILCERTVIIEKYEKNYQESSVRLHKTNNE